MLKKFLQRFKNNNFNTVSTEKEVIRPADPDATLNVYTAQNYNMIDIMKHVHNVEKYLKITSPPIITVNYIYDDNGLMYLSYIFPSTPPTNDFVGGYYNHDNNQMILAVMDPSTQQCKQESDLLFEIIHELRHIWQYTYKRNYYYNTANAIGCNQHICDESEVDADAFAYAYIKSCTQYNSSTQMKLFASYSFPDNGQRIKRAIELTKEYFNG